MVKNIAIGAVGLGFDSRPVKSDAVLPTARHRRDVAVLPRRYAAQMGSVTRSMLLPNTASIMKIRIFDLTVKCQVL